MDLLSARSLRTFVSACILLPLGCLAEETAPTSMSQHCCLCSIQETVHCVANEDDAGFTVLRTFLGSKASYTPRPEPASFADCPKISHIWRVASEQCSPTRDPFY